ncbi:MAG: cytochrome c biogenesis protein ResB [Oligoflexia bacterium]|nr:cytochrome c biogenesis protein ResB [Oligoflexia bacterium]
MQTILKFLGSGRFAAILIIFSAIYFMVATAVESSYGPKVAHQLLYKSFIIGVLGTLTAFSLLISVIQRMPFRKKLSGFYLLHLGILVILFGCFITYYLGIDGFITLIPATPNGEVLLPQHPVVEGEATVVDKVSLPFQLELKRFIIEVEAGADGTVTPKEFTSELREPQEVKIFMNHPFKYAGFTFYQSSYFPLAPPEHAQEHHQEYASVLNVNYDPGRFFKYGGSFLLILGMLLHYFMNYKKTRY